MEKGGEKRSDQFDTSLQIWSLQKSGPESEISRKSVERLRRYCKSAFYLKYLQQKSINQKLRFAISPEPLVRFARNFGFRTRFLRALYVKGCVKLIQALFAPFFQLFFHFFANLYFRRWIESKSAFSKKVFIWCDSMRSRIFLRSRKNPGSYN